MVGVWPMVISKLLTSFPSHIKEKSVLKACRADMPQVCWGEHCTEYLCHYSVIQVIILVALVVENLPERGV